MVRHFESPVSRLAVVGFALLSLAGCSSSEEGADGEPQSLDQIAESARERGDDWQASLLEDGDITLAEYDEGHRRNLECLTAAGMTYSEPERIVTDGFRWDYAIEWTGIEEEVGMRESSACFDENLGDLELAMSAWGDWQTDPALLAAVNECVANAGFEVDPAAKNYRDVWRSGSEAGLSQQTVGGCVSTSMTRVYPGAGFAVSF